MNSPARLVILCFASLAWPWLPSGSGQTVSGFERINTPGFGDRQNSYAWSMAWYQGKLYVGTNRNFNCVELATVDAYPHRYPPVYKTKPDPCITCTASPADLDLRAEIWCYTPESGTWERVLQSPNDVPNLKAPGKFVARDIGFRNMLVYNEADGTEALYIAGVSGREIAGNDALPRLLRTTGERDGNGQLIYTEVPLNLTGVPSSVKVMGFRAMAAFNGKMYITGSRSLLGEGVLLESDNPAGGQFRVVSPSNWLVYELAVFNSCLYVGLGDQTLGYSVYRTQATGDLPYTYKPIVMFGAGRFGYMASVVSMEPFQGRLYVGAAGFAPNPMPPSEIIRINPDDSWQVVVGNTRNDLATRRPRYALSGLPDGFGNRFNAHVWRMVEHQGQLYAGTNDVSFGYRWLSLLLPSLNQTLGFDLFATADGVSWSPVTRTGFGVASSFGARTMASTPAGLFVGSANNCYGCDIWLKAGTASATPGSLAVAATGKTPLIAWNPVAKARRYQVYRSTYQTIDVQRVANTLDLPPDLGQPGPFLSIGTTSQPFFRDPSADPRASYLYYVAAEDQDGQLSPPSNVALVAPQTQPSATFSEFQAALEDLAAASRIESRTIQTFQTLLARSRKAVRQRDLDAAIKPIQELRQQIEDNHENRLDPWEVEDLTALVSGLERRLELGRSGALPAKALER